MPQLGETVTEGTITRWLKSVGDPVERDEPLFEVSTDKVDSEVPAPAAGTITEIRVQEGDTVDVGTVLAVIGDGASAGPPPAAAPETAAAAPAAPPPAPAPETAAAAPAAPPPAPAPETAAAAPARAGGHGGLLLSPVVRRLLEDNGLSASEVTGTGLGGRITRADVLTVIDARRAGGAPAPSASAASSGRRPQGGPSAPAAPAGTGDEIIAFTNIRRRTAEHMVRSKATSPHALVVNEVDFQSVERVRAEHGRRFKEEEGFSLTYLPFVARATVEALHEWPNLNASVGDDSLIVHHGINLGIAVDLDHHGLIVPVIHRAEELTLRGLARRIRELADRARTKKLSADDIAGGTFSITNPGPFGTLMTFPVINQPQVGILSTDGVRRRPVVVEDKDGTESIAIHSVGMVSLAWDHRAVDGAYAAAFVRRLGELLAERDWASEL